MDFKSRRLTSTPEIPLASPLLENPAFRQWFGDSKIVNERGEPLVCYHGTASDFSQFKVSAHGEYGRGVYLSFRPESAHLWATLAGGRNREVQVLALYVKMEKPFFTSKLDLHDLALEEGEDGEPIGMNEVHRRLKAKGYDGIIGTGLVESDKQVVVFSPSQIKSAMGNSGNFDPGSLDINS